MPVDAKYRIVCLFARERGIRVLEWLVGDPRFEVVALLVHSRLPKSEDSDQGFRPEFATFREMAEKHGIPLSTVDSRSEAESLAPLDETGGFDFLATVSWRYLVPEHVFGRAEIGAVNAHRGKLPNYQGAEPVKRALQNGDDNIILTIHEMVAELDAGEVLVELSHPSNYDESMSLDENVDRIKQEMLPLYSVAVKEAIEKLLRRKKRA